MPADKDSVLRRALGHPFMPSLRRGRGPRDGPSADVDRRVAFWCPAATKQLREADFSGNDGQCPPSRMAIARVFKGRLAYAPPLAPRKGLFLRGPAPPSPSFGAEGLRRPTSAKGCAHVRPLAPEIGCIMRPFVSNDKDDRATRRQRGAGGSATETPGMFHNMVMLPNYRRCVTVSDGS